jgi:hypothetical protein
MEPAPFSGKLELRGLERRRGPSGRDLVDPRRGAHDDLANAAAGCGVHFVQRARKGGFSLVWSITKSTTGVLRLRYGIGHEREHTLAEIGRRFSVTGERIRQI